MVQAINPKALKAMDGTAGGASGGQGGGAKGGGKGKIAASIAFRKRGAGMEVVARMCIP